MSDTIIDAILEDECFQEALQNAVDSSFTESIEDEINEAISEHDTVLSLVQRVEDLEAELDAMAKSIGHLNGSIKPEAPVDIQPEPFNPAQPKGDMLPLSAGGCGTFQIQEDRKYQMFLTRKNGEDRQIIGLYSVTFQLPSGPVTRYVLAESAEGAAEQATCGLEDLGDFGDKDQDYYQANAISVRLPLLLRGWGHRRF